VSTVFIVHLWRKLKWSVIHFTNHHEERTEKLALSTAAITSKTEDISNLYMDFWFLSLLLCSSYGYAGYFHECSGPANCLQIETEDPVAKRHWLWVCLALGIPQIVVMCSMMHQRVSDWSILSFLYICAFSLLRNVFWTQSPPINHHMVYKFALCHNIANHDGWNTHSSNIQQQNTAFQTKVKPQKVMQPVVYYLLFSSFYTHRMCTQI